MELDNLMRSWYLLAFNVVISLPFCDILLPLFLNEPHTENTFSLSFTWWFHANVLTCAYWMQLMEYCELLDKADQCEDPYMRMAYACEFSSSLIWITTLAIGISWLADLLINFQLHGLCRPTMPIIVHGSLSIQSLERLMKWLTTTALHF